MLHFLVKLVVTLSQRAIAVTLASACHGSIGVHTQCLALMCKTGVF